MQVIAVHSTMTVPVEYGRSTITLQAGERYVMHDAEVASGKQAGAFEFMEALPVRPQRFEPAGDCSGRLVLPFIGGLGDAVSMLPVLASIKQQHPSVQVEVTTTPGPAQVFALSDRVVDLVAYPLRLEEWGRYDQYLTMEVVHETAQLPGRALPEVFAAALGIELTDPSFGLTLPRVVETAAKLSSVPLVGLAVGEGQTLRAYPQPMLRELLDLLVRGGICCVLLGHADGAWNVPDCPPVITDMRSKTPTVLELAVWLASVDVVVAHDSFVMHLAGALGRPAVALFAPTSAAHASPYAHAIALASTETCVPCHVATSKCPKGFDRCVAWDSAEVQPQVIADAVRQRLDASGRAAAQGLSAAIQA